MAQTFFCNDRETTVKTEKGMLKGYKLGNVYAFKGIPYATAKDSVHRRKWKHGME